MDSELHDVAAGSPPPYSSGPPPSAYSAKPRPPPPSGYYQTPSRGNHGYSPLPSYAPAPPVFQQQSNNTNVVVVGQQPQAQQPQVVRVRAPQATTYMALTAVLMVICFFHGNFPAFLCLIPAIICACVASDHNAAGEYSSAKDCGAYALCCNIFSIVYYVLLVVGGIVLVAVYVTVGFSLVSSASSHININIPSVEPPTCSCDYYWWSSSCSCNNY